jgi:hypothetical protein
MTRTTADWLVPNSVARARVVRSVRRWISTGSTLTGGGGPQGRPLLRACVGGQNTGKVDLCTN